TITPRPAKRMRLETAQSDDPAAEFQLRRQFGELYEMHFKPARDRIYQLYPLLDDETHPRRALRVGSVYASHGRASGVGQQFENLRAAGRTALSLVFADVRAFEGGRAIFLCEKATRS